MGKKKAAARGGVSKRTPSKGLSETGLEAVADDAFEQVEEEEAAAAIAGGGARTVNPELQKRLDLLAEPGEEGLERGRAHGHEGAQRQRLPAEGDLLVRHRDVAP